MTSVETAPTTNHAGIAREDYKGEPSTLCIGCGHDSISNHIMSAFYQSGIHPYDIAKMSGIGCSSKTPAYFISKSFGFNSMHGRMAPSSTGAKLANRNLVMLGISGDGDTASIGMGGFVHLVRRNLPIVYIVANNGVYGLTKGQFSATSDVGSVQKGGTVNQFECIDLCTMAIDLGCGFVARSFSGDAKQLVPLLQAALRHNGTAVLDVISPCVTFNNHDGSTKSFQYVKEHDIILQELGFIQAFEEKKVDYAEGTSETVKMNDGSHLVLRKLDSRQHDVHDGPGAIKLIHASRARRELLTGLFYIKESGPNFLDTMNLCEKPLAYLNEADTRPSASALKEILSGYQ